MNKINCKIVGDHPHEGESGYLKFVDGKLSTTNAGGLKMFEVVLEDCQHGTGGCFAASTNLKFSAAHEKLFQTLKHYF